MLRRLALRAILCIAVAPVLASAAEQVNVVKFVSFDCPVCRNSETLDPPIKAAVEQRGGKFIIAPVPRGKNNARERLYYAIRSAGSAVSDQARQSMYKGAQDVGYPLADAAQCLDWLRTDMDSTEVDWLSVAKDATGDVSQEALERAVRLALRAGVQVVPAYVLVRGSDVIELLDTQTTSSTELSGLRAAVLAAVQRAQASR